MKLKIGDKVILNNNKEGEVIYFTSNFEPVIKIEKKLFVALGNKLYTFNPEWEEIGIYTNLKIIKTK